MKVETPSCNSLVYDYIIISSVIRIKQLEHISLNQNVELMGLVPITSSQLRKYPVSIYVWTFPMIEGGTHVLTSVFIGPSGGITR